VVHDNISDRSKALHPCVCCVPPFLHRFCISSGTANQQDGQLEGETTSMEEKISAQRQHWRPQTSQTQPTAPSPPPPFFPTNEHVVGHLGPLIACVVARVRQCCVFFNPKAGFVWWNEPLAGASQPASSGTWTWASAGKDTERSGMLVTYSKLIRGYPTSFLCDLRRLSRDVFLDGVLRRRDYSMHVDWSHV
jgi:hypothetical protein